MAAIDVGSESVLAADGKERRREVPRSRHGEWEPPADRDPLATLAAVATYTQWLPTLRERARAVGLMAFYRDPDALAKLEVAEREARLRAWSADLGLSAVR